MVGYEITFPFNWPALAFVISSFISAGVALAAFEIPTVDLHFTLKGGITVSAPGDQPADVLQRADRILYQAKDAG